MKAGLWIIAFVRKTGEFDISFVWNERERKREERYFSSFREFKNRKILVIRIDNSFEIFFVNPTAWKKVFYGVVISKRDIIRRID